MTIAEIGLTKDDFDKIEKILVEKSEQLEKFLGTRFNALIDRLDVLARILERIEYKLNK
jgi:hypothetical protein